MTCELCELVGGKVVTREYYTNDRVTIVDCLTCGKDHPMIVLNHHGPATDWELGYMEGVTEALFLNPEIRKEQRKVKAHIHWHIKGEFLGCS